MTREINVVKSTRFAAKLLKYLTYITVAVSCQRFQLFHCSSCRTDRVELCEHRIIGKTCYLDFRTKSMGQNLFNIYCNLIAKLSQQNFVKSYTASFYVLGLIR